MDPVLAYTRSKQDEIIGFLHEMVQCDSPSDNPSAVTRFTQLFEAHVSGIARIRSVPARGFGPHLQCEFELPGQGKDGQILVLGHSDTVYPLGTLTQMPF